MRYFLLLFTVALFASTAVADDGLVRMKSAYDVKTTADRLESVLQEKGMTVFIRIDHARGAERAGKRLRPTELVIFGNPNVGTPLMQCNQTVGIDLPQKALIWEDASGLVWLSYNRPQYLGERHGIAECGGVLKKVGNALRKFASAATLPEK